MQVYWLTDQTNGEATLVDADTVERLLGIELGYVEWCIEMDRMFENGKWRVLSGKAHSGQRGNLTSTVKMSKPRVCAKRTR